MGKGSGRRPTDPAKWQAAAWPPASPRFRQKGALGVTLSPSDERLVGLDNNLLLVEIEPCEPSSAPSPSPSSPSSSSSSPSLS